MPSEPPSPSEPPMSRPILRTLLACAPLVIAACGSKDPTALLADARTALQSGDHEAALRSFEAVSECAEADETQLFQALRDSVVCQAHVNTDAEAITAFDRLMAKYDARMDVNSLAKLGSDVAQAGCFDTATKVITVATAKAGDDQAAKVELQQLADQIARSGDPDALAALRALGYVN